MKKSIDKRPQLLPPRYVGTNAPQINTQINNHNNC